MAFDLLGSGHKARPVALAEFGLLNGDLAAFIRLQCRGGVNKEQSNFTRSD